MINLQSSTYDRLVKKGFFGESFSNLLDRILDDLEGKKIGSVNPTKNYQNQGEASSI